MSYSPYPSGQPGQQPYPGGPMPPELRPAPPPSLKMAVRLMFAGAAASAISIIIGLATLGSLKSQLRAGNTSLDTAQINAAFSFVVASVIIGGIIGIALWIWIALKCRSGRNWARITGTVFFAIDTIGLVSLARPGLAISKVFDVLVWLVGLAVVIFLWRRESSDYFSAPRY